MACGFICGIASQIYIIILAFKVSLSAGLFCVFVTPVYALVSDLRKDNKIRNGLKGWAAGWIMIILSVIIFAAV